MLVVAGIGVGMLAAKPSTAESNALVPGSVEDPVVTKSYVDEQIKKMLGNGAGSNTGGNNGGSNGSGGSEGSSAATKIQIVELPVGKTLMADAGTEAVVRVGDAIAFSSDTNGLSDLTGGIDIKKGQSVPKNHLIWFPREGRGIQGAEAEKKPLTIMVKGGYSIK